MPHLLLLLLHMLNPYVRIRAPHQQTYVAFYLVKRDSTFEKWLQVLTNIATKIAPGEATVRLLLQLPALAEFNRG